MSTSARTASSTYGPLFSITHSAATLAAASVTSARDGTPVRASVSSTWVAQIAGTCDASQSQRISSCTSASRSKPSSTARSPRAIITAIGGRRIASKRMRGSCSKPARVSILRTMPIARWPSGVVQRRDVRRAADEREADEIGVLGDETEVRAILVGEGGDRQRAVGEVDALFRAQLDDRP